MDSIFIFFQHIVPQHLLSRCTGWLARLQRPLWLKNKAINLFARHFRVDMSEAAEPDLEAYPSFNAFFTRPLKNGVRPLDEADIVCPADGAISQLGAIREGLLFQAKGRYFSTEELLGGDEERAALDDPELQEADREEPAAVHAQDPVRARLERQVQVRHQALLGRDGLHQGIVGLNRIDGTDPHAG